MLAFAIQVAFQSNTSVAQPQNKYIYQYPMLICLLEEQSDVIYENWCSHKTQEARISKVESKTQNIAPYTMTNGAKTKQSQSKNQQIEMESKGSI